MLPPLVSSAARVLLLAASVTALLAACSPDPGARNHAARDRTAHATTPQGTWVRWKAYGDEASYLNTRYVSEGPPIVVEILDIWRPEPAFTYRIKDRRAFWCKEQEVALLGRWVSKNGAPFKKSELPEEMLRRKSIREYDVHSNTLAAPSNQIANLHRKVCNRYFGDRVADPMADFENLTGKDHDR